ncbi:MAG: STAS-like domain-containing protein [Bacteroidetes bacterium]|nr:STAS-like domain-containing protein [Bacteroidota bacterium]
MQENTPSINVSDAIGTSNAILHSFGMTVYDTAKPLVQENKPVIIDFNGIRNLTSAFLHASIGNLMTVNPNSIHLITVNGLANPEWNDKLQDAIKLALNPEKRDAIASELNELFNS